MNDVIGLLGPGILLAAPVLYAAVGGLFSHRAGIFNIALEGLMLLSACLSVMGAMATGSLWTGTLIGITAAVLASAVMAVIVVGFGADEVIVGIAVNLFAFGLTTFLVADAQTAGRRLELPTGYPRWHLSLLDGVPVLDQVFNDRDPLIWALAPVLVGVALLCGRTSFGLQLKAAGEAPLAARAAGVRVAGVRFASIVLTGLFCGVGGAELAIGSVHLFSENMTSGRGIVAFAAVIFGAGLVGRVGLACLLFGFAQALAGLLQIRTNFPSQFVLMAPFLLTIVAITVADALRGRRLLSRGPASAADSAADAQWPPLAVVGHLTIDEIRLADGQVLPRTIGGAAAYTAMGAFLGQGDALVVSRVGEDYPLDRLRLDHPDGGTVDTGPTVVTPGRSIHNVVRYGADGSRRWEIEDFGVLVARMPGPEDLSGLPLSGRWAIVTPAPLDQQRDLAATLRAAGAKVALDTELHYLTEPDAYARLCEVTRLVDCFLPSRDHLDHLVGEARHEHDLPGLADELGCSLVVVKSGAQGVRLCDAGTLTRIPAVPEVRVVDPTGAGDGFNGGFLAGLSRGEAPTEAAITGCVAASFVVESIGIRVPASFSTVERTRRYRLLGRLRADTRTG